MKKKKETRMAHQPAHEECAGCQDVRGDGCCAVYADPNAQWRRGGCPRHPETRKRVLKEKRRNRQKVNPLKASKRREALEQETSVPEAPAENAPPKEASAETPAEG